MRILGWVQAKISQRQEKKRFEVASARRDNVKQGNHKEEFSDWPNGLLAIGTFGNSEIRKEPGTDDRLKNSHSLQDLPEFTMDEVSRLEKQLTEILSLKRKCNSSESYAGRGHSSNLSFNKSFNCTSSEVDQLTCQASCDKVENGETGDLSPNTKIILNKAKDLLADSRHVIGQKSISFLLKKMFVCRSGFTPAPSLRDPISESRMEKLLKTILHKKIYPQNSAPMTVKKYLEQRKMSETEMRDKILMMMREKACAKAVDGCKWVKTDSEYIVLEI